MIELLILDLDDTLISERDYQEQAIANVTNLIAAEYGPSRNLVATILGTALNRDRRTAFQSTLTTLGIEPTKERVAALVERHRLTRPNLRPYDDLHPLLSWAREATISVAVLTDGHPTAQRYKLDSIHAYTWADHICVTSEHGPDWTKPSPLGFLDCLRATNSSPDRSIYVGDNPGKDFAIVNELPISTARIARPDAIYATATYYNDARETWTIGSLMEIIDLANHLGGPV